MSKWSDVRREDAASDLIAAALLAAIEEVLDQWDGETVAFIRFEIDPAVIPGISWREQLKDLATVVMAAGDS